MGSLHVVGICTEPRLLVHPEAVGSCSRAVACVLRGVAPYKPAAPLLTSPPASNKLCLFTAREEPELTAASRCAAAVQKLGGVSPHLYADAAPRPGDKSSRLAVKWFGATAFGCMREAHPGFIHDGNFLSTV